MEGVDMGQRGTAVKARQYFVWVLLGLILYGLLGIGFIGLAEEGTWVKKADMPTGKYTFSTSVVNGNIYAIGGLWDNDGADFSSAVEEYDPIADKWTKRTDMPTARRSLSTSVANGKLYAMGGSGPLGLSLAVVEEYDLVTDKWTRKSDMLTARSGLSTSAIGGRIYAIGGSGKGAAFCLSTVEEYDTGLIAAVKSEGKLISIWEDVKRGR